MKLVTITIAICMLSACSKVDKSVLEQAEFKDLIGTWKTDHINDELVEISVQENGKVKITRSTERGEKFYVKSFTLDNHELIDGDDTLKQRMLDCYKNGKSHGFVIFFKKMNSDSAFISYMGDTFINNFETDTSSGKIYFYRQ